MTSSVSPDPLLLAERYYGLVLTSQLLAASDEQLTDQACEDLFDAHLRTNYSYFGGIDKTLSGFFVLSDEDDNYTLADVRDPQGGIYWQDHETREISLLFESLEDYIAYERELAAQDKKGRSEKWHIREQYAPRQTFAPGMRPSTPELAERYQWLVWLLAQMIRLQTDADLTSSGTSHFLHYWETPERARSIFQEELPLLPADPHLAIYWLLHHTCLADEPCLQQTLQACQDVQLPLYQAFANRLSQLTLHDTLDVLPSFRTRRSKLLLSLFFKADGRAFTPLLHAFLMDEQDGLLKAWWLWESTEREQQFQTLRDALGQIPQGRVGVAYLLARLDQHAGLTTSHAADVHCQQLLALSLLDDRACLATFYQIYPLAQNHAALAQLAERFLQGDPYLQEALKIARHAYEHLGNLKRVQEMDQQLNALMEIRGLLIALEEQPGQARQILERMGDLRPDQRRLLARRILFQPGRFPHAAIEIAILYLLEGEEKDRNQLLTAGMLELHQKEREVIFDRLAEQIKQKPEGSFPLTVAFLTCQEPDEKDFVAKLNVEELKIKTLHLLAPSAHQEHIFDFLMEALCWDGFLILRKAILQELFMGYSKNKLLLRLSDTQACRVLEICIQNAHEGNPLSGPANSVIFYFRHPGAEELLITALQQETEEGIKGSLYSAIRNLHTAQARTALVERLIQETSSYWRMANALHEIFDQDVHQQAMALIERTKSVDAANNYAATLAEHVKQGLPLVDLVEQVLSWPSVARDDLPKLKYVLLEGAKAALLQHRTAIAKNAFLRARKIPARVFSNYHTVWLNPFEQDLALQRRMDYLLSDAIEARQATLLYQKSERARRQNKPLARVSDAELGIMTGADVRERLFRDAETKEIWFLDINRAFRYFDGYWVVDPPFEPVVSPDIQSFLADVTKTTQRLMFWTKDGGEFQEFVQYQQHILSYRGINNAHRWQTYGLVAPSEAAASAIMHRVRLHMDKRFVESSPWYVQRHGAVFRTYYTRDTNGREWLGVMGSRWVWSSKRTFPSEAQAIQAYEEMELQKFKEGTYLTCIEWLGNYKKPEDMMLLEYFEQRIRDYSLDVIEYIEILKEFQSHLQRHDLADLLPDLEITIGSGITEEEIQDFIRTIAVPIPEPLQAFWRHFGHASWRLGELGIRILSPAEIRARYLDKPDRRILNSAEIQERCLKIQPLMAKRCQYKISASEREKYREQFEGMQVLTETLQGIPVIVWATVPKATNDSVFTLFDLTACRQAPWFEGRLPWMFNTRFLAELIQAIAVAVPDLRLLKYGTQRDPGAIRRRFELRSASSAKFWEIVFDKSNRSIGTRSGKIDTAGASNFKEFDSAEAAEKAYVRATEKKIKEGYIEVTRT